MARLHSKSEDIDLPALDFFTIPGTQLNIDRTYDDIIPPSNSLSDNVPAQWKVSGSGNSMIDMQMSRIKLALQVVKKDGEKLMKTVTKPKTDKEAEEVTYVDVGVVNNLLNSLMSQFIVKFNGVQVTPFADHHPIRSYLQVLLENGSASKNGHFQCQLFYKDTPGHMNDRKGKNEGFNERKKYMRESEIFEVSGPIMAGIFKCHRYLLNEVNVECTAVFNTPEYCLMAESSDYKIKILNADLIIRRVEVGSTKMMEIHRQLKNEPALYPYERTEFKTFKIATDAQYKIVDNMFLGVQPKKVIIGLLDESAYAGNIKENPFNFQHFNITKLAVNCGSQQFPGVPLEPNFKNPGQSVDSFYTLYDGTGIHHGDDGIDINRREYLKGYTLWVFDLTNDRSASTGSHWNPVKLGNFRVEVCLDSSVTRSKAIVGVVLAEFDAVLKIDERRQISITTV
jgi:hypothetical protein